MSERKPLFLIEGKSIAAEQIAEIFEHLSGREATEEEMAEVAAMLARRQRSDPR
jgi:hypothetical protein